MSRMYDALGLQKTYHLQTELEPKDTETIRTAYRDALYDYDHSPGLREMARHRAETLKAIFGAAPFREIDAERNPCPYRQKAGDGTYVCQLAVAERKRRNGGYSYSTACHYIEMPCHDPLNPKNHAN